MKNKILKRIDEDNYKVIFVLSTVKPTEENLEDLWNYITSISDRTDKDREPFFTDKDREPFFNDIRRHNFVQISFENTVKANENKEVDIERLVNALERLDKLENTEFNSVIIRKSDNALLVNDEIVNKENVINNMIGQLDVSDNFNSTILSTILTYSGVYR